MLQANELRVLIEGRHPAATAAMLDTPPRTRGGGGGVLPDRTPIGTISTLRKLLSNAPSSVPATKPAPVRAADRPVQPCMRGISYSRGPSRVLLVPGSKALNFAQYMVCDHSAWHVLETHPVTCTRMGHRVCKIARSKPVQHGVNPQHPAPRCHPKACAKPVGSA